MNCELYLFPHPRCDPSTTVQAQAQMFFFLSLPNCHFFFFCQRTIKSSCTSSPNLLLFRWGQAEIKVHKFTCAPLLLFSPGTSISLSITHTVFTFNKNTRKKVDENLLRAAHLRKRKKKIHTHTHTKPIFELKLSPTAIQGQISVTLFCLF